MCKLIIPSQAVFGKKYPPPPKKQPRLLFTTKCLISANLRPRLELENNVSRACIK